MLFRSIVFSGLTSMENFCEVSTVFPLIKTAPTEMISAVLGFSPVVSKSRLTHSSGGGGSNKKAYVSSLSARRLKVREMASNNVAQPEVVGDEFFEGVDDFENVP